MYYRERNRSCQCPLWRNRSPSAHAGAVEVEAELDHAGAEAVARLQARRGHATAWGGTLLVELRSTRKTSPPSSTSRKCCIDIVGSWNASVLRCASRPMSMARPGGIR